MSVTTTKASVPTVSHSMGGSVMVPQNMDQAIRLAEMLAKSKNAVPAHFQGDPGACLLAVDQAMRWGMSPFAVMQATFVHKGKLGYEGKLVAAAVQASNAITGLMQYRFEGSGDGLKIICSATRRGETAPKEVEVTLAKAKTDNDNWKKNPDQMLVYHSARVWTRRWAPGVILGVYTREEIESGEAFEGQTIEGTAAKIVDTGEAAGTRDAVNASVPLKETPAYDARVRAVETALIAEPNGAKWMALLKAALAEAESQDEIAALQGIPNVEMAMNKAPPAVKGDIQHAFAAAFRRMAPTEAEPAAGEA